MLAVKYSKALLVSVHTCSAIADVFFCRSIRVRENNFDSFTTVNTTYSDRDTCLFFQRLTKLIAMLTLSVFTTGVHTIFWRIVTSIIIWICLKRIEIDRS